LARALTVSAKNKIKGKVSCGSFFFFFLYLTPGGTGVPSLPRGMGRVRRLSVLSLLYKFDPA